MQHERVDKTYKYVEKTDLPYRLAIQFHDCGNYTGVASDKYNGGPPICGNCNKIVPWFFFKCVKCDQHFIQDFRHPKFCSYYPTCWQHTLELPWDYCPSHAFKYRLEKPFWLHEPIGLNPKVFSDEDLADVFDF